MRCIDVAALVAASILRQNPRAEVIPFESDVVNVQLNGRDSVMTNADGSFRYVVVVERQAADKPADRPKKSMPVARDTKALLFSLVSETNAASGQEIVIELTDPPGERVKLSKAATSKRVDGYLADLKYPPENRAWPTRRKGDKITFGGETYNIVAIAANEVVLSAPSGKMSTVRTAESNR